MLDGNQLPINRRKLLIGLGTIGVGAVLGGVGSYSVYNDQEQINVQFTTGQPSNNTTQSNGGDDSSIDDGGGEAGQIDLEVFLTSVHNDEIITDDIDVEEEELNAFRVHNEPMLPGDEGAIYMALQLHHASGSIGLFSQADNFAENTLVPAEEEIGDTSEEGELQEIVSATIGQLETEPADFTALPPDWETEHFNGLVEELAEGTTLDEPVEAEEGEVIWFAYYWSFPEDAGNQYQTDSYDIIFRFGAQTPS